MRNRRVFPLPTDKMEEEKKNCLRRTYDAVPSRVVVAIQCFFGTWCSYMLRINLSMALVTMVYPTVANETETLEDYGPRYNWTEKEQGHLLAAYFYGSVVAHIPGGMVAEQLGPRLVVGVTSGVGAFFTILSPLAAELGFGWIIAARVIIGVCGGPLYPCLHSIVSQWAPPHEKGKFVWCLLGGTFGMCVTWPLQAQITIALGWKASFYIMGGIVGVWTLLWFLTVYDSPSIHPRITPEEREYILSNIGGTVTTQKRVMPFVSAMTSVPYLALIFLHFGNLGGLFFIMTEGPKYMAEVLKFNLRNSGLLAALPYLMRLIFGIFFSLLGDWCISKPDRSRTTVRKLFVISSHLLPALMLALMGYVEENPAGAVALLALSLGFNGASTVTSLANHHDLAPNYAGSMYGIMNAIGTCTGFIFPVMVGFILHEGGNDVTQWRLIFWIGSGLYLASGLTFILFGSGQTQPWNLPKDEAARA